MVLVLLSLAAAATSTAGVNSTSPNDGPADRMICERMEEIGSRLNVKKVCMTRSQWQAQRDSNKMDIDKAQTQQNLPAGK